jgi:hypothetical protein
MVRQIGGSVVSHIIEADLHHEQQGDIECLETAVRRRLNGRLRNFRLLMCADGLILHGDAITFHAKQLAQHAIMEATDLPILANEIVVAS